MINTKSFSIIDKSQIKGNIHVVGVGALGSRVVENLVRLNLASKIVVYDMDIVEEKNLNNQCYFRHHIGMPKVEAIRDFAGMIDSDEKVRIKNKKVEYIRTKSDDILILAIDNFEARGQILSQIEGNPLVISGGISSIGGNFEVVRGADNYLKLANEYLSLPSGLEYDENDLTPCGSPISIFHRIGFAASLIADSIIGNYNSTEDINTNIIFDTPNKIIIQD